MKTVRKIIQYILAVILALAILALILINIFSSTILSENYVLSKLEEENYYEKIYEDTESNFENYIYQSGLDEEVLNNIVTKEKIEKDTKIIISNIYDKTNEEIDTEEIANQLNQNIEDSLNGNISNSERQAINKFVDTICEEYKSTISHTNYEEKINSIYQKVIQSISLLKKALLIVIVVCVVLIVLLTFKRIHRAIARIGTAFTIDGLILLITNWYINDKIRIEGITILNNAVSEVLRNVLTDILSRIMTYGSILLGLGILFIIIYSLIKSIRKIKREKEQYTPEN